MTSEERFTTVSTMKGVISVVGLHCLSGFLFFFGMSVCLLAAEYVERGAAIPIETSRMAPEKHHEEHHDEPGYCPQCRDPQRHAQPFLDVRENFKVKLDERGLDQP